MKDSIWIIKSMVSEFKVILMGMSIMEIFNITKSMEKEKCIGLV